MITENEKLEILEHEAMIKEFNEALKETMKQIKDQEYWDKFERTGCAGHPAEE